MIRKIQGILTALWYRLTSPPYRLLKKSTLFDSDYYLDRNPDVAALGMDPLVHYLTRGFAENRSPGPLFDNRYYLHQMNELSETIENPLLHFLNHGREGLRPNLLVDPVHYVFHTPEFAESQLDPLFYFLQKGGKSDGFDSPSPYFDPQFYCRKYPDAAPHAHDPVAAYRHFFQIGLTEMRQPSAFFDTGWYLDKAPILHEQGLDPLSHYHLFGIKEGKSPSPLFDPEFYAKTSNADGEQDLFTHYLRREQAADNRPCAWFDPAFYRQKYLAGSRQDSPLKHYLERGVYEEAYPNREVAELAVTPRISVVVPVYNVAPAYLNNCIRSVLYQSYPHWELCLVDDCSTDTEIRPLLRQWADLDGRIKVAFLPKNGGISAATNAAAALATGKYLAFLDNDDELAPDALFTFVRAMDSRGGDLLYSDEDLIGADGTRFSVFRKPGFNRELLLCHNYVTHCVVAEKALFDSVGGCDSEMNGAQDHDLFLKLAEQAERVTHVPEILYHWRASESSTSINHSQKEYADEAGSKSVAGALARLGIGGNVQYTELKFFYRARRFLPQDPTVTVLVYWQRAMDEFKPWLTRLMASAGATIDQLVVAVGSPSWVETVRRAGAENGVETDCLTVPEDSGPAAAYNSAVDCIRGEFVALVDCLIETPGDGWLAALLEYGGQEEVGLVGGRVDYPPVPLEVTPIPDCSVTSPSYYARFLANCSVLMNGLHCPQEVRSVTGEFCLIRTAVLREAGGFNAEDYPSLLFVQDLAFRLNRQGKVHIYTPYCSLTLTAQPDSREPHIFVQEKARFQRQWFDLLNQGDPFYNTGLLTDRRLSLTAFQAWLTGSSSPHIST